MTNKKRKGFSITELVVSALVLSVIMLGAVGYTAGFIDVSYNSSKQMMNINQARSINESIAKEITNAAYIYPANTEITLSVSGGSSVVINTNNSIALLYKDEINDTYGFTAFYIVGDDLYQFTEAPGYSWDANTSPALSLLSFTGNASKIVSNIDTTNTSLSYDLNYDNGLVDDILEGQISGIATNDPYALIKGIDWQLAQSNIENSTIKVKELSRNVPRFYE